MSEKRTRSKHKARAGRGGSKGSAARKKGAARTGAKTRRNVRVESDPGAELCYEFVDPLELGEIDMDASLEELDDFTPSEPSSKLTRRLVETFCQYITLGRSPTAICDYLGISYSKYNDWLTRGARYLAAYPGGESSDAGCAHFVQRFRKAHAQRLFELQDRVGFVGNKAWRRDLALLERLEPEMFSRKVTELGADESSYDPDESFL